MRRAVTVFASIAIISGTTSATAQEPGPAAKAKTETKPQTTAAPTSAPKPVAQEQAKPKTPTAEQPKPKTATDEEPVITHHKIQLDGKELAYTATAGLMPIKDSKGETEARIFYIAYTRDNPPDATSRPVMFSFNGGPGSASIWLHMGTLGPRRVVVTEQPVIPAPPFRPVDNDATWLDRTDLVFIDPVGTGFSRAAKPELNAKFHALQGDITSVGEFIRMYLTRYDRWASPLYLIGESYGTTRAAGLAGHLVDHGIALNGLVLVSCALDFQGFVFGDGNELPYVNYLPAYAAAAWYHKKLPADLQQRALPAIVQEVEQWADREYVSILARGDAITDAERQAAVGRLVRYTGLDADEIEAHNLRISQGVFCKELLKHERRVIGRFDARYQGVDNAPGSPGPGFDPSLAGVRRLTRPRSTTTCGTSCSTRPTLPTTYSAKGSAGGTGRLVWDTPRPKASSRPPWPRTRT